MECNTQCSGHGQLKEDATEDDEQPCKCDVGWRGEVCQRRGCPGDGFDCTKNGFCNTATQKCACIDLWEGDGCQIPHCPRADKSDHNCTGNGECLVIDGKPVCQCVSGWMGADCADDCNLQHGTPIDNTICSCDSCYTGAGCNQECNNHGTCVDKKCSCDTSWWGTRCEDQGCPGDTQPCSGHGVCLSSQQKCYCAPGKSEILYCFRYSLPRVKGEII